MAVETKIDSTQWGHVAGKDLYSFFAVLEAVTCADRVILHALLPATSLLGL